MHLPTAVRHAAGAACLGLLLTASGVQAAVTIQSFSLSPAAPTTGDPVTLTAVLQSDTSCDFLGAHILYAPQAELQGSPGWGLDVEFGTGVLPVVSTCPIEVDLGTLPIAAADGVLRARDNGAVTDRAPFHLEIAAGPVRGWEDPVLHGSLEILVQSAAATALPDRLALGDSGHRKILFLDPDSGTLLSQINAPGSGDVRGLAWDGSALFASVRDTTGPRIYRVDLLGRILDAFASPVISPGSAPLEGLAYLDGVLYGSYESPPTLFAIQPSTHVRLWSRRLITRMLALDASPGGLIGAEPGGTFYLVEPSETGEDIPLADPLDTAITNFPVIQGLAYGPRGIQAWDAASSTLLTMRSFALWWASDGTLRTYVPGPALAIDVLRGDLNDTALTSGFYDLAFFAPAVCLASRNPGGTVADPVDPPEGHVFFYLARVVDATGNPTFYGRISNGFRRIDSGNACP